jgi:signal transduction histidine kinase
VPEQGVEELQEVAREFNAMALRLERQSVRLDRLVEDLLDTARIEAGRMELKAAPVELGVLVREACELHRTVSPVHTLEVALPPGPLQVECDAHRISQVLHNLLSNALKYSPAGGTVRVRVRVQQAQAVVEVEDPGLGIAPEELPLLFQPFRRTSATRQSIPGVGLGLWVSRRIIEAHGGRLEVESTPGTGSLFRLQLPLQQPPRAALRA